MGWFDAFRKNGWNTYYSGRDQSAVMFDVKLVIVSFVVALFTVAFILLFIGSRGRDRWMTFCRLVFTFQTGAILLICITGQNWQDAHIHTHCTYLSKPGYNDVSAAVGVRIGLKSINITMKGSVVSGDYDYNERFSINEFTDMEKAYQDARQRGLPDAILYVAEYFRMDEGGLRWTRNIRLAGHFAYILLWSSFAAWIVSNITVMFDVACGSLLLTLTGVMMIGACVIYVLCQPSEAFVVRFVDTNLKLHYGWCFWLCIISGLLTFIVGVALFIFYVISPRDAGKLFLLDWSFMNEEDARDEGEKSGPLELDTPNFKRKMAAAVASVGNTFANIAFDSDEDLCKARRAFAGNNGSEKQSEEDEWATSSEKQITVVEVTSC